MKKLILKNEIYNVLKWFIMIFIPASITLVETLGQIYGFETQTIILTTSAITTFLGVITGISNYNYNKNND